MTITLNQAQQLRNGKVLTTAGAKVGSIGQVYLDDTTGEPSWITAKTGIFGSSESFIPLQGARLEGDDVVVDYDEDTIKNAPRVDPDGHLEPDEETALYRYYNLDGGADTNRTVDVDTRQADRSNVVDDGTMTRSEEQLHVGVASSESGRARLRKYVTTEQVTQTVPVSHEEVTLTREPITDGNRTGAQIGEEVHEVVLHREVPVVDKEVVAVERIKLGTETVTEQVTVSEEVRKEQVEIDDPTSGRR